ncbi:MAG: type IX secretion system sortase PorU [Bacteroidales bacterium]
MRKTTLLVLIMLLAYFSLNAQSYKFSYNFKWSGIEKIQIDSARFVERMAFEGAVYDENILPVLSERLEGRDQEVIDFEWETRETAPLTNEEIALIKDKNIELDENFDVRFVSSTSRKMTYNFINLLPLRLNPQSGKPEKLLSFTINITTENIEKQKFSRSYADNSALNEGEWYKIRVEESGMYELSYSMIQSMGFENPGNIGVFGYGGMVPKRNADTRYDDLPERPVYLQDNNNNNSFDAGDALIVYLEGPNEHKYEGDGAYKHVMHNYSDHAYYFLSDQGESLRYENITSDLTANQFTDAFDYNISLEKDSINLIGSGRDFYWRHFDYYLSYTFNMSLPNVISNEPADFYTRLAARSQAESQFKIKLNGATHYSSVLPEISGTYSAAYAYSTDTHLSIPSPQESNTIQIEYLQPQNTSEGWLNYLTINARASLQMDGNFLRFRDSRTMGSGNVTQYTVSGVNSSCIVLDVTDPVNAFAIEPDVISGGQLKFTAGSDQLREYVVFDPNASFSSPQTSGSDKLGFVSNQNLHAFGNVDYVIVTNSLFSAYAEQLAAFHQSLNGLSTIVVDQELIFNEFSSGTPDVAATRDFMKMLYDKADSEEEMPKYLLLFGDGSYDNKTTGSPNSNYILTYQSTNSLRPTNSFVSDDFYGLLDDDEGSVAGPEGLDVGIGRLPVRSHAEAEVVLDKIFSYVNPDSFGAWRNLVAFIADDAEDSMTHELDANETADSVIAHYPVFNIDKIFLDAYEQVSTVQGDRYPEVNQEIDERVEKGALIVNYTGHGNAKTLAHENVVTLSQINSWANADRLPVFVTATCEFSRFDDYEFTSAGEQILLSELGGAVALLTTTRLVYSGDNDRLNKEFYRQIFKRDDNNQLAHLGEVIMHTKNNASQYNNKRNFSLLGDPALQLAVPEHVVQTDSVKGQDLSVNVDTIGAASHVTVYGHLEDRSGNVLNDFNGLVYPKVYDKMMEYSTLGNDQHAPMDFKEQTNILYSGKASVENGYFSFEFIVPVDIAYYYDHGKISYYAASETNDAHGFYEDIVIGGSADTDISDAFGPDIELYMNNTDFVDGGITDENPDMLAFISDESGINTVGNGIGHDIVAVLDDNTSDAIILNDYYEADVDSYQSGSVTYPFSNLSTGMHTLSLKVWDVFNNSAQQEISFMVANSTELVIEQIGNFPNPFSEQTCFTFTHNHANEELDVEIKIYDMQGALVKIINEMVYTTGFTISPICWQGTRDGGGKVEPGIYVYHVRISSPNGDVVNKFEKLVFVK